MFASRTCKSSEYIHIQKILKIDAHCTTELKHYCKAKTCLNVIYLKPVTHHQISFDAQLGSNYDQTWIKLFTEHVFLSFVLLPKLMFAFSNPYDKVSVT